MKRFIPVFLAMVVLAFLIGTCFAETVKINGKTTEITKDAKGWYYLNDNGSKMRFSDVEAVRAGQPFMATLSAEDMSVVDIAKMEQDKTQAEVAKKQQDKERLIRERMDKNARDKAVQELKAEGKIE